MPPTAPELEGVKPGRHTSSVPLMPKQRIDPIPGPQVERIARILGDTSSGLTGTQIGWTLQKIGVADVDPSNTKWIRIYNALVTRQNADQSADRVLAFIHAALDPVQYHDAPEHFEQKRRELNVVLAFAGFQFRADGRFERTAKATTLSDAHRRADELRSKLGDRHVHPEVLRFCRAELLQNNYFHAVLEATKSVADAIRTRTGLTSDGAELVQQAFGGNAPLLRINSLQTAAEQGEQRGFVNLLVGLFGTFRNPTAHAPRIAWDMAEEDALDLMTLASYAHRRISQSHGP